MNIRAVYLHVLGDALGSLIVMLSASIVLFTRAKWTKYVDPCLSIIMVLIIFKTSLPLLKDSGMILMQKVPQHLSVEKLEKQIVEGVEGVLSVSELCVWQLSPSKVVASLHVRCTTWIDFMNVTKMIEEILKSEGVDSITIQPTFFDDTNEFGEVENDDMVEIDDRCVQNHKHTFA